MANLQGRNKGRGAIILDYYLAGTLTKPIYICSAPNETFGSDIWCDFGDYGGYIRSGLMTRM